jgi:transcriptional regulator with XRE-family HTH domain
METSNDCFVAALQKKLKDQGRGGKQKLAALLGITPNHLSDILGSRKNAGQKLKERIADALGVSFEEMLALGRQIIEGRSKGQGTPFGGMDHGVGLVETREDEAYFSSDFIAMAKRILESDTPFRQALMSNISAYHQALESSRKEKESTDEIKELQQELQNVRKEIEGLKR